MWKEIAFLTWVFRPAWRCPGGVLAVSWRCPGAPSMADTYLAAELVYQFPTEKNQQHQVPSAELAHIFELDFTMGHEPCVT